MSDQPIIQVENLGKRYRLGATRGGSGGASYRTLRESLSQGARRLLPQGRPADGALSSAPDETDFWALRDVSFNIRPGEVVGIIGRNGAGKSTLLKILSRITEPTEGRVTLRGRVASLLEVGTGFHPELTGRENVYLNGAILGMGRHEIRAKFDEIVAFAEVERFLDTPVKRYSSGMYVRLAFAVAAHLEPEILIVDEVLAVGDAQFQKKCLGKMQDVAKGGRTVLFVSHNMAAISSLTSRCCYLERGSLLATGDTPAIIERYTASWSQAGSDASHHRLHAGKHSRVESAALIDLNEAPVTHYTPGQPLRLLVVIETDGTANLSLDLLLVNPAGDKLAIGSLAHFEHQHLPQEAGSYEYLLEFPSLWLASGDYKFDIITSIVNVNWDDYLEAAISFEVGYSNPNKSSFDFKHSAGYGSLALVCINPPQVRNRKKLALIPASQ